MKTDPILSNIITKLRNKYACHTIILYGSRARGDFTPESDYDVVGISNKVKEKTRDARLYKGKYVDAFVFPEIQIRKPDESMLYMKDGIVLLQKKKVGNDFLKKLDHIFKKGPRVAKSQQQVHRVWIDKMLARTKKKDAEGNFRRLWLVTSLLEYYFEFRDQWYLGSKESLSWLKQNDVKTHALFLRVFKSPFNERALSQLVKRVMAC